ncbi:hypothetical protein AYJ58_06450 [Shewanella sp. Pdp11]|uniref:hypothetical protein n=1 Tax=Shewanella sp. Pdp11 TaxID=2059264 RepID=UPI000CA3800B|nr:hypothetical protein [Shewanella sp. Pdp11]AUD59154.1 hypothetical protein AYJ58_06450 [Shewanella sp. Pdp11]
MGLPVTVYRWDDAGAPQLVDHKPSEIINLFKKCLINGYGSKAGLGWTLEYEDAATAKAAFRNSATQGSGGYMRVWSSTGADGDNVDFRLQTCKSMTDIDTMISSSPYATYELQKSLQSSGWELIGTSRGFWFHIYCKYPGVTGTYSFSTSPTFQYAYAFFVGDLDTLDINDAGMFTQLRGSSASTNDNSIVSPLGYGASFGFAWLYDADNSPSTAQYKVSLPYDVALNRYTQTPSSVGVSMILTPMQLIQVSPTYIPSITRPPCRGFVPGTYQASLIGFASELWPLDLKVNNVEHTLLFMRTHQNIWINKEVWYA